MTLRRLGILQWLGLVAGGAAVAGQHLIGYAVTETECSRAGAAHGISNDAWQLTLMLVAAAVVIGAGVASVAVLGGTRDSSYEDEPELGRIRFFAIAALVTNAILLGIVMLDGIGATVSPGCASQ
jgi:hypothetical protein